MFTELLLSLSRETDIVARYGGEEFVVILPETDQAQAILAAERYCAEAASTPLDGYGITVSIGAATVSAKDTEASLVHQADLALYASKSGGRNRATHAAEKPRGDYRARAAASTAASASGSIGGD